MSLKVNVIKNSNTPLIDRRHTGSVDNVCGYENGHVIRDSDGMLHMLITEMFDYGKGNPNAWVPARIGYWVSVNGENWVRIRTVIEGNDIINDPKEHTWSPSFYWNENEDRWNIFWRGNKAVFRYRSRKKGIHGIGAVYDEAEQIWPPLRDPTGKLLDFASFSNIFRVKDGRLAVFYCYTEMLNGRMQWLAGMAYAENPSGPWTASEKKPIFLFCENPYVTIVDGVYMCVFDDLSCQRSIGVGYSYNGLEWENCVLDLNDAVLWANESWYVNSLRTPLGLIYEGNNKFTVYFTAAEQRDGYFSIGKIQIEILREKRKAKKSGISLRGAEAYGEIEYGELSIDSAEKQIKFLPVEMPSGRRFSAPLRCVDTLSFEEGKLFLNGFAGGNPLYVTQAGIYWKEKNGKIFSVMVCAEGQIMLREGDKLIEAKRLDSPPYIFRTLTIRQRGEKIVAEYGGKKFFCWNGFLSDSDGTGICWEAGHWHYKIIQ